MITHHYSHVTLRNECGSCISLIPGHFGFCSSGLKLVDSSHPTFSTEDVSGQCVIVWTSTGAQPLVLKGMLVVVMIQQQFPMYFVCSLLHYKFRRVNCCWVKL